jgi:[ribosomal protein S5]-alanine N-acetyltransferase
MPTPPHTWQTPRLLARPAVTADAGVIFDHYASDPAVSKYMTWRPHRNVDDTLGFLRRCETVWQEGSAFPWTLWIKDGGAFAGMIEIRVHQATVDLGYALAPRWWRQGLMTEALTWIVHWALDQPTIFRVWATCDVDNVASARVLERVGMQPEGVLRRWIMHPNISEEPRDSLCYAVVRT